MVGLTGKTVPPDPAEKRFLECPPKGNGVEIFPGRFQPEAGQLPRVTHQQWFPIAEHLVAQDDRCTPEQNNVHVVGPENVARGLDVLHEGAGTAAGDSPFPGQDGDVHIAALAPGPPRSRSKKVHGYDLGKCGKPCSHRRTSGIRHSSTIPKGRYLSGTHHSDFILSESPVVDKKPARNLARQAEAMAKPPAAPARELPPIGARIIIRS